MLGNAIKQTTSTTGTTTALALTAVAGFSKFSDSAALAAGAPFAYGLIDANGNEEWGIGRLIDSTTMARAVISKTFVAGVLNEANPSPINLSGACTIICTPHAATLESMLPTVDAVSAGIRRYLYSAAKAYVTTAAGPSALTVQYMPFLLRCAARITSLGINVTVGAGQARLGLYLLSDRGYFGPQLVTTTDIDTSTSGFKSQSLATPLSLPPGQYATGFVGSSGSIRATAYSSSNGNLQGGSPLGFDASMTPIEYRMESAGALLLPSTPSATTSAVTAGSSHPVIVYLGVE